MKPNNKNKDPTERCAIVDAIKDQLIRYGIAHFDSVIPFQKMLHEYTKPNVTGGFSGRMLIPEISRHIEYSLPIRKNTSHVVRLVQS